MKQKLLIAAALSAMLAAPSLAVANDGSHDSGWYLKGNVGYGVHTDIDFTKGFLGESESEGGTVWNLGTGYDFGENWRIELDATTMHSEFGTLSSKPLTNVKFRTTAVMLNTLYDFSDFGNFAPYIGAGIGLVDGRVSVKTADTGPTPLLNPTCPGATRAPATDAFTCDLTDKSDTAFGYQLLAGLGYAITDNLSWDTQYRFLDVSDLKYKNAKLKNFSNPSAASTKFKVNLEDAGAHQVTTGLRYRFGKAAPVMAPVPVADYECWDGSMVFNADQCPAQVVEAPKVSCWDGSLADTADACPAQPLPETYTCPDGTLVYDLATCPVVVVGCAEQYRQEIVYYGFDESRHAGETRDAVSRALNVGDACSVQAIRVTGHTDTSGSAAYNLSLSKRRANDVVDELVRQGVDRANITSDGKGETELFIQTGDNVREHLNRRSEILMTLGSN